MIYRHKNEEASAVADASSCAWLDLILVRLELVYNAG
jgi:hypothetical protein